MLAYSTTVYDWIKLVHVLAAVAWVGSSIFVQLYATKLDRSGDRAKLAGFAQDIEFFGGRLFAPASVVVLVVGVVLVWYDPRWAVKDLWVILAILGFLYTFVTGAFVLGPESGKLGRLIEEGRSPDDPELQRRIHKIFLVSRFDLLVLVLVVTDMVVKPGS